MNLNLEYSKKNTEKGKRIPGRYCGKFQTSYSPDANSRQGYKTTEGINSVSGMAYLKLGFPKIVIKAAGLYGQSMYDYTMIGGYAHEEHSYYEYTGYA